MFYKTGNVRIT